MVRALLIAAAALALVPAVAGAAASLPDIEDEVMCPVCGTPLNLAEDAPLAERERDFIRVRIARGESKERIKRELVGEFGPEVLALPEKKGFDLAAYLVPIAAFLAALAALAVAVTRWRRRRPAPRAPADEVSPAEARRLDEELARFDA